MRGQGACRSGEAGRRTHPKDELRQRHHPAAQFISEEAEVVEGDLTDIDSLEPLFAVPEGTKTVMLHIASFVSVKPDFDQRLIDINVGGCKNVIEV